LAKHQIALYAQRILHETLETEALEYDRNPRGILYFYRSRASLDRGVAHMQLLAEDGQQIQVVDRAGVLELDPSLGSSQAPIAGGVYCPTDETGDCSKFTTALAASCAKRGTETRTGVRTTGPEAA